MIEQYSDHNADGMILFRRHIEVDQTLWEDGFEKKNYVGGCKILETQAEVHQDNKHLRFK